MRTLRLSGLFFCTILMGAALAGCRPSETTTASEAMVPSGSTVSSWSTTASDLAAGSMKGYELYSWQDGDQWFFSLLVGTNRSKTLDEIRSPGSTFKEIKALQAALETIPAGQFVTWLSRDTLVFPFEDVMGQVEQICKDRGLQLNIAK